MEYTIHSRQIKWSFFQFATFPVLHAPIRKNQSGGGAVFIIM